MWVRVRAVCARASDGSCMQVRTIPGISAIDLFLSVNDLLHSRAVTSDGTSFRSLRLYKKYKTRYKCDGHRYIAAKINMISKPFA